MRYQSTRGTAPELDFRDVTLAGLAKDGGLYVPVEWPSLSDAEIAGLAGLSYVETAVRVMAPFTAGSLDETELRELCTQA
jgi:threonine synthase